MPRLTPDETGDEDPYDAYDEDSGLHQCPGCGVVYSGNGGYIGAVWTTDGTEYEIIYETDPDDKPFYCEDCWDEKDAAMKQAENQTLDAFTND